MVEPPNEESLLSALEHAGSGAVEAGAHWVEANAEATAHAFQEAGATAEEAEHLLAPHTKAIPLASTVISAAEVGYHAGHAAVDLTSGHLDEGADHLLSTAETLASVATGGVFALAEGAWDGVNALVGGDESTTAHASIQHGLEAAGNEIGDAIHYLIDEPPAEVGPGPNG
jgi:hypothetical protein